MGEKTVDNMKIWDHVSKTDPGHTKQVDFGRKFTAIDELQLDERRQLQAGNY